MGKVLKQYFKYLIIYLVIIFVVITNVKAQLPVIKSFSPVSGCVGTLIKIIGSNFDNLDSISIGGIRCLPISNSSDTLVVMVMPYTKSSTILVVTTAGSVNSFNPMTIVPTKYPKTQIGNKLVSLGGITSGVAVSADGNIAITSGKGKGGSFYTFFRSGNQWIKKCNVPIIKGFVPYNSAIPFGAVALSADGNTAAFGCSDDDHGNGAIWIFTRKDTVWTQQGNKLIGQGAIPMSSLQGSGQGSSVALSADGNTLIEGGAGDNKGIGAAWLFTRIGSNWIYNGNKLIGSDRQGQSSSIGASVALSADGNTAVLGGPDDDSQTGAAWVFYKSSNSWFQQGTKLVGSENFASSYAGEVSISADGNTIIIGGFGYKGYQGAAWVFTRTANIWTQQGAALIGNGSIGGVGGVYTNVSSVGKSVSLSADGNTAIVGGYTDNSKGATWVFTRTSGNWSQPTSKLVGLGSVGIAYQGVHVSLSADGSTAFIVGSGDSSNFGAAWIYSYSNNLPVTMINFSAAINSKSVKLSWEAFELNNSSFVVQSSLDGTNFIEIDNIKAKGSGTNSYEFTDNFPTPGLNYYRVKSIDKDGSYSYSKTVSIIFNSTKSKIALCPNPANDIVTIIGSHVTEVQINTIIGNRVVTESYTDATNPAIKVSALPAGIYIVTITTADKKTQAIQLIIK
ncbi:T9SS type A sorting domain-containing protein [Parasediminibacterium sp. JCM 36343]|uniref:T9SS type A sorting domain-containing protein n=1 Tax=Parasediminibacterium sp. JCM 36343 TaxID=3374279 RepID=UPI00397B7325